MARKPSRLHERVVCPIIEQAEPRARGLIHGD
jgi:hypothetical protein